MSAGRRRGGLLVAGAVALALLAGGRDRFEAWVAATELPPLTIATGREVLAADGSLLRAYTVADGRWRLAAGPVDAGYAALLIAMEDRRFADHAGVDPLALLRAGWQAVRHGRIVSGGSTLTMQVARLLEEGGTGAWAGKIRQMRLALALERRLTKPEILALYLDLAPYGGNVEGVRAAALTWFGKEPWRLTAGEAALLVALPQSPAARRPDRDTAAARAARDRVLYRGVAAGVIAPERLAPALATPLPQTRRPFPALAPQVADRLAGAVVRTTLDARLQREVEALAARAVAGRGDRLSAAILVADHRTGAIRALAGSARYGAEAGAGWIDMTRAFRSPGSTLKPLVYALAFDQGLAHPETLIEDRPLRFGTYAPQNFDRTYHGTLRVRQALQLSLNIPVVQLTEAIGPARLMAAMRRAGMAPRLAGGEPGLAVALGGVGVTLEDLAALYAGLAEGGQAVRLSPLPGEGGRTGARITSPEAAWQVADILTGLMPPPGMGQAGGIAWKTGTSYGHRDALALGFDGRHVVAVWLGRPDGTPVPGAFGADLAAPVLFEAFARLAPAPEPLPPPPPGTLMLSNAELPLPLRRFRGREAAFAPAPGGPRLAFPPEGAEVEALHGLLAVKITEGTPPFTWLAEGRPLLTGPAREARLPVPPGPVRLSVIDAEGRGATVRVTLR